MSPFQELPESVLLLQAKMLSQMKPSLFNPFFVVPQMWWKQQKKKYAKDIFSLCIICLVPMSILSRGGWLFSVCFPEFI